VQSRARHASSERAALKDLYGSRGPGAALDELIAGVIAMLRPILCVVIAVQACSGYIIPSEILKRHASKSSTKKISTWIQESAHDITPVIDKQLFMENMMHDSEKNLHAAGFSVVPAAGAAMAAPTKRVQLGLADVCAACAYLQSLPKSKAASAKAPSWVDSAADVNEVSENGAKNEALPCEDKGALLLASLGRSCNELMKWNPTCEKEVKELIPSAPPGHLVWEGCQKTCNLCGTGRDPSGKAVTDKVSENGAKNEALSCEDKGALLLASIGRSCNELMKWNPTCEKEVKELIPSAPPGHLVWEGCQKTCNLCGTGRDPSGNAVTADNGAADLPASSPSKTKCVDRQNFSGTSMGCSELASFLGCDYDMKQTNLHPMPKNTLVKNLCPCECPTP
jgi:hypothetical protein